MILEVIATCIDDALRAEKNGANRLELITAVTEGGMKKRQTDESKLKASTAHESTRAAGKAGKKCMKYRANVVLSPIHTDLKIGD